MLNDDRLQANEAIAKITSTSLGYEDHGILTAWLTLDYGGSGQGAGGYGLDDKADDGSYDRKPHPECGRWVAGVIGACGVEKWEDVKGRTIIAIRDGDGWGGGVVGIRPLPTEKGKPFMFDRAAVLPCKCDAPACETHGCQDKPRVDGAGFHSTRNEP